MFLRLLIVGPQKEWRSSKWDTELDEIKQVHCFSSLKVGTIHGILFIWRFWVNRVGPEFLRFLQALKCCLCNWFADHTLSNKVSRNLMRKHALQHFPDLPCFWHTRSSLWSITLRTLNFKLHLSNYKWIYKLNRSLMQKFQKV